MEFIPFFHRHDSLAKHETRAVTLPENNEWDLPGGEYGFVESFCIDDACDCRKAMIAVCGGNPPYIQATIGYGWESAAFYTTWLHGDEEVGTRMVGSYLEPGAQQSPASHKWLKIWNELIIADETYRTRILRHYRLFKNKETREDFASPEQYGISSPAPALPDAEAELAGVLRLYDIEKYVSIDHIRTWLEMLDVDDHDYMAPFAILMGLAAEWKDASRETTEDVIGAVRTFCNSLPRKKLNDNSPEEAFAHRGMENKAPHFRNSLIEFGRWVPHYDTALAQLHAVGEEKAALDEFRMIFRLLLEEHTTTRHVFRMFANAAIACFAMGDEYGGVRLLKIASEINPHYDFAKDQLKRYESGECDDLIIDGIMRQTKDSKKDEGADATMKVLKRRRTNVGVTYFRAMASLFGRFDDTKTRIPLAQIPRSKHEERNERKRFEAEPWHAYYLFLKKFDINFNHPLEEPSEVTFHRSDGMKIGRNDPCPCGSGKKYKKCHGQG